jgi:peroxisomal membrane protein 2
VRALNGAHIDAKAIKMALYGFLISAPMSHFLIGLLQKAFEGKTSTRDRIAQIVASNLLVSPIQATSRFWSQFLCLGRVLMLCNSAYLASMAVLNGASSIAEVIKTVKAGFFSVIRVSRLVFVAIKP